MKPLILTLLEELLGEIVAIRQKLRTTTEPADDDRGLRRDIGRSNVT